MDGWMLGITIGMLCLTLISTVFVILTYFKSKNIKEETAQIKNELNRVVNMQDSENSGIIVGGDNKGSAEIKNG